jgi:hypothetical protein
MCVHFSSRRQEVEKTWIFYIALEERHSKSVTGEPSNAHALVKRPLILGGRWGILCWCPAAQLFMIGG